MSIPYFLVILSGLLWTVVYIDSIRIGLRDKTYAMPLWALGLNFAWEFLYFVLGYRESGLHIQTVINGIWCLFDVGLVYTYFRYGRKTFPKNLKPHWFTVWSVFVLVVSFIVQITFVLEFQSPRLAGTYAAYLQNLLMSVLFIVMLVQRGSSEGQTMLIAISKFVGSLAPTILMGVLGRGPFTEPNTFVLIIGSLMAVVDLIYIWMLAKVRRLEKHGEPFPL